MASEPLLKVKDVGIQFGGLKAVSNFNMEINQGELSRIYRTEWSR